MTFPDVVAAELLAHELLQQHLADGLERGIGQQQLDAPAAVVHVDAQLDQDGGVGRPGDGGEARVGLQAIQVEGHLGQGLEGGLGVVQHHLDHPLHQHPLDGGVGAALDAHGRGAAAPAQQHVHDRVDQVGVDDQQAVVVELLGAEHRQDRRQGDGVQVIAEAHRRDVVQAHFHVVRREVAQGGRHQAHQAVEDDLEHRQTLVGHQGRVDDRADAAALDGVVGQVEAKEAVDLVLVEDALGRALLAPGRGGLGFEIIRGRFVSHQLTSISSMSTALAREGAMTRFTRRRISLRSW